LAHGGPGGDPQHGYSGEIGPSCPCQPSDVLRPVCKPWLALTGKAPGLVKKDDFKWGALPGLYTGARLDLVPGRNPLRVLVATQRLNRYHNFEFIRETASLGHSCILSSLMDTSRHAV
jgi:hypothetical protein